MKNLKVDNCSYQYCHPDPENSGEGSVQLTNLVEIPCLPQTGSLLFRMTFHGGSK